jgi:Mn2+/Fe2+ NRAMP family transporter
LRNSIWRRFGPGFLLAAASIGASHLVLSPRAGSLFGFSLLWLVLASHIFKYPAFEFGPRYAAATGQSLLAGYKRVRGPRNWALYLFLLGTVMQGVGVLAGVVSVSGCVLYTWTGALSTEIFSVILVAAIVILLVSGGFSLLDNLNKAMMLILALATVLAFAAKPPAAADLSRMVIPEIPDGSIVLVAAILGWMPTGIDVSVWHSFWTLEKLNRLDITDDADRSKQLKISLADMRTGYGLSMVTGVMFMSLGAIHLAGLGAELSGVGFAQAISSAYTNILGRWMYHVFMLTAFFALFSTSYTVIDGFSRSFSEAISCIREKRAESGARKYTYFGFVFASSICAAVTICCVGNPVAIVTAVAILSLAIAPVLYALNLRCVSRDIADPRLRPSIVTICTGWAGVLFMVAALAITVWIKLFQR